MPQMRGSKEAATQQAIQRSKGKGLVLDGEGEGGCFQQRLMDLYDQACMPKQMQTVPRWSCICMLFLTDSDRVLFQACYRVGWTYPATIVMLPESYRQVWQPAASTHPSRITFSQLYNQISCLHVFVFVHRNIFRFYHQPVSSVRVLVGLLEEGARYLCENT